MAPGKSYDDDEVRAIIERALSAQPRGGLSHEDLLAIGEGVGLSREAIEQAGLELRERKLEAQARAAIVGRRRRALSLHAFVFLVVNATSFAINALTTPGEWWALFPIFGWGLALLLHAGLALLLPISERRLARERARTLGAARESSSSTPTETRRVGVRVADASDDSVDESSELQDSRAARQR